MSTELLKIQPRELKFTFDVKKESSCSVELINNSDQYVAFKVKTTSPKKYCVRPNTGIIKPNSTCAFTVTMQAQRSAPPDKQCKDKFLIQSTIVPFGTTAEDITSNMFANDKGNYIEENKLRVALVSPIHSPVLLPINGALNQEPRSEDPILKDQVLAGVRNLPAPLMFCLHSPPRINSGSIQGEIYLDEITAKDVEGLKVAMDEELRPAKRDLKPGNDVEELKLAKEIEELKSAKAIEELKLARDIEELKSKVNELETKLFEAEVTITKITEERSTTVQERETLQQELAMLRRNNGVRRVQVGFPLLFVCMVALISLTLGYLSHC